MVKKNPPWQLSGPKRIFKLTKLIQNKTSPDDCPVSGEGLFSDQREKIRTIKAVWEQSPLFDKKPKIDLYGLHTSLYD
jgi:hypothetical protein